MVFCLGSSNNYVAEPSGRLWVKNPVDFRSQIVRSLLLAAVNSFVGTSLLWYIRSKQTQCNRSTQSQAPSTQETDVAVLQPECPAQEAITPPIQLRVSLRTVCLATWAPSIFLLLGIADYNLLVDYPDGRTWVEVRPDFSARLALSFFIAALYSLLNTALLWGIRKLNPGNRRAVS
ncbi:MAG: hypothetical protein C5B50_13010 [Verrucomicrobia bacterium]|nr:MAG: hypothetical protein C5B50_13010 [Verrucomicrobiota bacterium]